MAAETGAATRRSATNTALQAIDGIGDVRVDGYGDDLLAILAEVPCAAASVGASGLDV